MTASITTCTHRRRTARPCRSARVGIVWVMGLLAAGACGRSASSDASAATTTAQVAARPGTTAAGAPAAASGLEVFQTCAMCHQAAGQGLPGVYPPLAGSEWLTAQPAIPIRIVLRGLKGPITVEGHSFTSEMQEWGTSFSDAELAAVLTYARSQWGNHASAITAEQVAAVRRETASHTGAWTAAELERLRRLPASSSPEPGNAPGRGATRTDSSGRIPPGELALVDAWTVAVARSGTPVRQSVKRHVEGHHPHRRK